MPSAEPGIQWTLKTYSVKDVQWLFSESNFEKKFKDVISSISSKSKSFFTQANTLSYKLRQCFSNFSGHYN